nr:PP0621 family protein [Pusillimonas minor]
MLFWIIVVIVALVAVRLLAIHNRNKNAADNGETATAARKKNGGKSVAGNTANPESMVRCAHCGIHMPRSEAVLSGGDTWCSTEHAKLGVRQ